MAAQAPTRQTFSRMRQTDRTMPRNATSLASWIKAIQMTLQQGGVDGAPLFAQAGLDMAALNDPNARYPLANTSALWRLAVAATGQAHLGLLVAKNINQTTFHALGFSLLASTSLRDFFERIERYFKIVSDAAELEFVAVPGGAKFVIHPLPGVLQPADEALDAMLAVIVRGCRSLYDREFSPQKICLRRSAPAEREAFETTFRAPLYFSAAETAIYIAGEVLDIPLPSANAELARHNDKILADYLAGHQCQTIADRVHAVLVEQLPMGVPSREELARSLNMSLRNLQRKLSDEETSYKAILNDTRCDLALSYMADKQYTVSDITYLLGFADTSSFTRAFKRWTGVSPREYRTAAIEAPLHRE